MSESRHPGQPLSAPPPKAMRSRRQGAPISKHEVRERSALVTGSHERAGSRDKRIMPYDGLYHEILNEPERGRVVEDLAAWLDERVTAPVAG